MARNWLQAFAAGAPIALITAIGLIYRPGLSSSGIGPPPPPMLASDAGSETPSAYCIDRMLSPLRALAAGQSPAPVEKPKEPPNPVVITAHDAGAEVGTTVTVREAKEETQPEDALAKAIGDLNLDPIEVRIATVPDPSEPELRYNFDTVVQSLRLGVEAPTESGQYLRDATWLPWGDRFAPSSKGEESEACRLTTPAMMTFRSSTGPRRLMVLLLVGETPVEGIHQRAMRTALDVVKRLSPDATELQLIGPTFSGSATSLRLALDRSNLKVPVRMISGSATGDEVAKIVAGSPDAAPKVQFRRTTRRDSDLECAFMLFARHWSGVHPAKGDRRGDEAENGGPTQVLENVALLYESGTEFGDRAATDAGAEACAYEPEVRLRFPFHVSAIRDAYDTLDQATRSAAKPEIGVRPTVLDVPMRDRGKVTDIENDPSPKTTVAEDLTLTNLLATISRTGARYVAIRATDTTDAIFVARKVRDVAPDVRLVFFVSDALFLHPEFRQDLLGSFVISPYPFFGTNDFTLDDHVARRTHMPFNGSLGEGVFNAVLAAEHTSSQQLLEYDYFQPLEGMAPDLPIWFSAIGRSSIAPISVRLWPACGAVYTGVGSDAVVDCGRKAVHDNWPVDDIKARELEVDPDVTPPNFWHIVFGAVMLAAVLDRLRQRQARAAMMCVELPAFVGRADFKDQPLDHALGVAKFHFYSAIRTFVFVVAIGYMGAVQWLSLVTYGVNQERVLPWVVAIIGLGAFVLGAFSFARRVGWYLGQAAQIQQHVREDAGIWKLLLSPARSAHWQFGLYAIGHLLFWFIAWPAELVRARSPVEPRTRNETDPPELAPNWVEHRFGWVWRPISRGLGFAEPDNNRTSAETSLRQLEVLACFSVIIATALTVLLVFDLRSHGLGIGHFVPGMQEPNPNMTLFVLRSLPLTNGISPAAPILVSLACVYCWVRGRMARLQLVHGVSLIAPKDGISDAVSTPIRFILFPAVTKEPGTTHLEEPVNSNAAGVRSTQSANAVARDVERFTHVERCFLNAILRPSTGASYFAGIVAILLIPVVLFALKTPSTMESVHGTLLLFGSLSLCSVLITATLLQFVLYWLRLDVLLKRISAHPLGRAFDRVYLFVRDSIEDQVSRSPNDLLRLAALATKYAELARRAPKNPKFSCAGMAARAETMEEARRVALAVSASPNAAADVDAKRKPSDPTAAQLVEGRALGQEIVNAASELVAEVLEKAWCEPRPVPPKAAESEEKSAEKAKGDEGDLLDGLENAAGISKEEVAWVREAQSFVVTTVATIVNRHVRQFRFFLYTLTACALLLLFGLSMYAFEPRRLLLTCIWAVMGTVVGVGFWIFFELEQNTLLSRITGTEPGRVEVSSTLVWRVVSWGVLPLVSVAAAQYPSVASALLSWTEPFLRALH
jgi:hypothetical protein